MKVKKRKFLFFKPDLMISWGGGSWQQIQNFSTISPFMPAMPQKHRDTRCENHYKGQVTQITTELHPVLPAQLSLGISKMSAVFQN